MIGWTLRECMARRGVTMVALAKAVGVAEASVSNWYHHDHLPRIGAQRIEEIRSAIESLSLDRYGECKSSELVKLED